MQELRQYQTDAINTLFASFSKFKNPLIVAPTGSGKSHMIAGFINKVLELYPKTRILMLTHRQELIGQNAEKLLKYLKDPYLLGIYSAGLGMKDVRQICFAGIQSIHKNVEALGHRDLVLIDECHLVPKKDDGMYQKTLKHLQAVNPKVRICGFTATPFRLDSGLLIEGDDRIFDGVAYEVELRKLIVDSYLSVLITKSDNPGVDMVGMPTRGGDYVMSHAGNLLSADSINQNIVNDILRKTEKRNSVLIFACSVDHCKKLYQKFDENKQFQDNAEGVEDNPESFIIEYCTGETPKPERDRIIRDFKSGKIKYLINCELFTTGFDAPNIDAICLVRPTKSVGLFAQMVGRGLRIHEKKKNCLVLDYAGNIERFGPLDSLQVDSRGGKAIVKKAPTKECPYCQTILALGAKTCPDCGHEFTREENKKLFEEASKANILAQAEIWEVDTYDYGIHRKEGKPPSMRVIYSSGNFNCSEFICIEHGDFPTRKAQQWWVRHGGKQPIPETASEMRSRTSELMIPKKLTVIRDGKFYKILDIELAEPNESQEKLSNELYENYGLNV